MIPDVYIDLVNKLYDKTMRGQVNWQKTAVENKYLVDFRSFSLTIELLFDRSNPSWINLQLYDSDGKKIDSFTVDEEQDSGWFGKLDEIYGTARRKALRIDEAINLITKELDTNEPVGAEPSEDFVPEIEDDDVPM
jgi:hypothetical protein